MLLNDVSILLGSFLICVGALLLMRAYLEWVYAKPNPQKKRTIWLLRSGFIIMPLGFMIMSLSLGFLRNDWLLVLIVCCFGGAFLLWTVPILIRKSKKGLKNLSSGFLNYA